MQTKKAKYHLKRIETILNLHEGNLSSMDRDILLEDIRHLYDLILFANNETAVSEPPTSAEKNFTTPAPAPPAPKPTEQYTPILPNHHQDSPIQENKSVTENHQNEEIPAPLQEVRRPVEQPHSASNAPLPEPTTRIPEESPAGEKTPYQEPVYSASAPATTMNSSVENGMSAHTEEENDEILIQEEESYPELFDFKISSDLSDRLANTKIEHLNKILTINDKILFINHLFGGEAIPFQESLKKFESFYTYDEAKQYAARELVPNYNWTDQQKYDTVRQFMQQVRRLYI